MSQNPSNAFRTLADADPAAAGEVQEDVIASEARFRIIRAGRRWGKTEVAAHEAITAALKPDAMVWWVSNSANNVRRGYRKVQQYLPPSLYAKQPSSEAANSKIIELVNGSRLEFYTAGSAGATQNKDSSALTGEGVDFLVIDEAALIDKMVWFQHLRPTLSDTGGRAIIISTPRGRNWFWQMVRRGEGDNPRYHAFHYTSFDNPHVPSSEHEEAKDELPEIMWRQEYLAEFTSDAASIFTVDESRNIAPGLGEPYGQLVAGLDLAKKEDWTVLDIARAEDRQPVVLERWQKKSWPETSEDTIQIIRDLEARPDVEGVTVMIDSTGLGDVVYDTLDEAGLDVVEVNFGSGRQKEAMVKLLAADLEHGRAKILMEQLEEFDSYEYNLTPTGRYQFEAAVGHDDYVSAKMLQNWGIVHEAPPGAVSLNTEGEDAAAEEDDEVFEDGPHRVGTVEPDSYQDLLWRDSAWS
jgi:hypothetical protein